MKISKGLAIVIFMYLLISFGGNLRSEESSRIINKITSQEVEVYKEYYNTFIIRFSHLIYEVENKKIKIPIFQGIYGDILYKDFRSYCLEKKFLEPKVKESGFVIKAKKGELRKTFHDFLKFYKSNILKDTNIEDISSASLDDTDWTINYDFTVDSVPCYLKVEIEASEEDLKEYMKYKSVYQIKPNEKMSKPNISYGFYIGMKSTDRFDVHGNKIN